MLTGNGLSTLLQTRIANGMPRQGLDRKAQPALHDWHSHDALVGDTALTLIAWPVIKFVNGCTVKAGFWRKAGKRRNFA